MIGAGGGFILVPLLLFLYPDESAEVLTAISLAVVCCNAASGSVAYARKGRIDYRSAAAFALISLPGAVLGAAVTRYMSRRVFDPVFGFGLIAVGLYLALRKPTTANAKPLGKPQTKRSFKDRAGQAYHYVFDMRIGLAISAGVGFISSVLGIGGGIIHVPALVYGLGFPVHVATATSHLILAAMSLVACAQHYYAGSLQPGFDRLMYLAPGVICGAPFGARLSERVRGSWILRALALALLGVGARLLL